jgi:hypothetical protein
MDILSASDVLHRHLRTFSDNRDSATAARRATVDAGYLEVVATSMTEHRQRETGLHRVPLLTRRTLP